MKPTRPDSLAWLRDENWQEVIAEPSKLKPEIREHLLEENRRAETFLETGTSLRKELFAEMKARIRERDTSAPLPHGAWMYYEREVAGGEHSLFCRKPRGGGRGHVLLDGNREARGKTYYKIGDACHSPDHKHFAWSEDNSGGEEYLLQIRDIETKKLLKERITMTDGSFEWSRDGESLFYVRIDEHHRPRQVFRHKIGSDVASDVLIFEEKDPRFFASIESFGGGEFIGVESFDHNSSEYYLLSASEENATPRLVRERREDIEYNLYFDAARRRWLIRDNKDAQEFRVMAAGEDDITEPDKWREWLPHKRERFIEDLACLQDHVVLLAWENALPRLCILDADGKEVRHARFSESAYEIELIEGFEHPAKHLRFFYSSMKTPGKWFDYDPASGRKHLRKSAKPPGDFSSRNYKTERIEVTAEDGASIPVSLLYHRDTTLDGSAPLLLYGYGAYGITTPAGFSPQRMSLVDRGFVWAIAHVRGGRERGQAWYLDGKRKNKTNSFSDFIAVARGLIAAGYTHENGIHAWGGSAGGLLVGASVNRAPELFCSAVAMVPFVDVLATMQDASLPLTPIEWLEWGNPIDSDEDYKTIASYSPVDCVHACDYPYVMATAGVSDPRVGYWEPAKWAVRLREASTSNREILLRTEMDAGHGGTAGRFKRLEEIAFLYSFVIETTRRSR
ncbi:MAG: S9 family peptidase [Hyphomicrobiales bacterium]|nr:S9 family peptidase [Hyphomicrobiales bacterium]